MHHLDQFTAKITGGTELRAKLDTGTIKIAFECKTVTFRNSEALIWYPYCWCGINTQRGGTVLQRSLNTVPAGFSDLRFSDHFGFSDQKLGNFGPPTYR